jgi:dTMP kinase
MTEKSKDKRGFFLTFEGVDGAGKTTQMTLLAEYLRARGYQTLTTREPGGTPAGEKIRALLLDPDTSLAARAETLLYLAARADHVAGVIQPALAAGRIVLCDRFSDSTYVYQGIARALAAADFTPILNWAAAGLTPDLTLLLDAPPEQLFARRERRGGADRMEKEGLGFQIRVRDGFLALAKRHSRRIAVLDGLQAVDELQAVIRRTVETRLGL